MPVKIEILTSTAKTLYLPKKLNQTANIKNVQSEKSATMLHVYVNGEDWCHNHVLVHLDLGPRCQPVCLFSQSGPRKIAMLTG